MPSSRSCVERTSREIRASEGAEERIRSPITVWRWTKTHSSSVSGPVFERIESGIASFPTSCSSAVERQIVEVGVGQAERLAHRPGEPGDGRQVPAKVCVALVKDAEEHLARLPPGRRASAVLVAVQPGVCDPERLGELSRLVRQHRRAVRGADLKAVAFVAKSPESGGDDPAAVEIVAVGDDAELVASHRYARPNGSAATPSLIASL